MARPPTPARRHRPPPPREGPSVPRRAGPCWSPHRPPRRTAPLAALAVCAAALAFAAPAGAVSCASLQAAINGVSDGGTVTVDQGTCTGMSFTLPAQSPTFTYTIQGAGSGATFNGGAPGERILTGTDVGIVTLRNLTFENSTAPLGAPGGAIRVDGNSGVTLDND